MVEAMNHRQHDEERIFHVARAIADDRPRNEYLDQVCSGDQGLRERVEALLVTHETEESFLASNNFIVETADHAPIRETEGQQIGRFKLLQRIGEGGFGVVFMAEQQTPVKRKVALKIIKPGMDTREVVARFEAERQALALMDHTNIAKVLDGGATESGRPFFVMELVKGVPITEYCDQNQLSTKDRLRLFTTVCQAVQHAHQKGIIHRDLKPSNVLVTLADGQPVVKVIDFGVAKANNQKLTEKTFFTAFGQMVGTPQYMSPEQAEMSCLDVDTRSDVYSLGVLLYELLSGTTPLEAKRLRTAGYAEMQRMIREEEPLKPSTRLSTSSGEQLTAIAKHRAISPDKLTREIRGDLDWIVMKALEKDRNRRYESPGSLGADVDRTLNDEPVEACPPSQSYRLRKFIRRNRLLVLTATIVTVALVCGLGLALWGMNRARDSAKLAENQREKAETLLRENFELAVREVMLKSFEGEVEPVQELLKKYESLFNNPEIASDEHWPTILKASAYLHAGKLETVDELLSKIVDSSTNEATIPAIALLSTACFELGEWERPILLANRLREATPRRQFPDIDRLFLGYAMVFIDTHQAVDHLQEVLRAHPNWLICHTILVNALIHQGAFQGKESMTEDAYNRSTAILELVPNNPYALNVALFSRKCMIEWRQKKGLPYEEFESSGMEIAHRLRNKWSTFRLATLMSAQFYETIGDQQKADEAWLTTLRNGGEVNQWAAIGALYRNRDSREMIKLLDDEIDSGAHTWVKLAKAYILADIPEETDQAMRIFEDAIAVNSTLTDRYQAIQVPLLLGNKKRAVELANRWVEEYESGQRLADRSEFAELDFLKIVATDGRHKPDFDNRMKDALANYLRGLLAICDGNREQGLDNLEAAAEKPFGWLDPYWARALTAQLERNQGWPRGNPNMNLD